MLQQASAFSSYQVPIVIDDRYIILLPQATGLFSPCVCCMHVVVPHHQYISRHHPANFSTPTLLLSLVSYSLTLKQQFSHIVRNERPGAQEHQAVATREAADGVVTHSFYLLAHSIAPHYG